MTNAPDNPLPGVPLVESPFFDELFTPALYDASTLALAQQLHTKGYAIVDLGGPAFDALASEIVDRFTPTFQWDWWRTQGHLEGGGMRIQDGWREDPATRQIAGDPRILELLSTLYGRPAFPFQTLTFPVGTQQHFHSDAVHFSSVPERFMCGVWVALEDVHEDAGPLVYYPGSHRWPIYGNEHIGRHAAELGFGSTQEFFHPLWNALVRRHDAQPETFLAKKGQALIWAANLLHGGAAQRDPMRTRWSMVSHYYFEDCVYYTPMNSDPFQGNIDLRAPLNVLTGEPVTPTLVGHEPRPEFVAAVALRTPDLPEGFDPALYLEANPDVKRAGADPVEHWLIYGRHENRPLEPEG